LTFRDRARAKNVIDTANAIARHLPGAERSAIAAKHGDCAGVDAGSVAHSLMDTAVLNYAIGAVLLAGVAVVAVAILVW
jgi:hypothetical protein